MQASSKIQPQLSLGLVIDPGAVKSIELELDKIIAELQQKCKLTITVDTTQATKAVEKVASSRSGITKAISNAQRLLDDTRTKFAGLSYTDPKEVQNLRDMIAVAQQLGKKGTAKDAADLADQTGIARRAIKALGNEFAALDRHKQTLANLRAALNMRGASTSDLPAELQAYEKTISSFKSAAGVNGLAQLKQLQDAATGYVRAMQKAANAPAAKQSVFDAKKLNSFDTAAKNMEHTLANLSKQTGIEQTTKEYQRFVSLLQQVSQNGGAGFEKLREASISAQHSIQDLNKSLTDEATIQKNYNRNAGVLGSEDYFSRMRTRIGSFSNADQNIRTAAIDQLAKLQGAYNTAQANKTAEAMQKVNVEYQKFIQLLGQVSNSNSANNTLQRQQKSIESLTRQIQEYMAAFSNGLARNPQLRQKWDELLNKVTAPGSAANESALRTEFAKLSKESHQAGVEIETVGQRVRSLFGQHFNTALIMAALNGLRLALRQLWQDIRDVNDALVQTQVVTGLTGAALENYTDRAYAAASRSRDTVVNILESATAFGRLGYDSDLSVQLAELTSMYSKLGDTDVSSATDAITAMMKAFRLEDASEIEAALDKLIYVGNNFPISAAGLGEGLNNAASALASAGNSLEETLSLLMAANATVQNPAKASTAMRTITARIRNTTAELDELGESLDEEYNTVAKYRAQLKGLSGVDILQADGKTFRSTYDILQDLSKAWQGLTDAQRAAITTMVAGTRNTDIFASLMQNFPEAEAAMAGMDDAAGLMDEKFTAVADSISGAISELSNAFSKFSTSLVNSKDVVQAIRALTGLVNVLDKIQSITGTGGLVAAAGTIAFIFNNMKMVNQNLGQIQGVATQISSGSWSNAITAMKLLNPQYQQMAVNIANLDQSQAKMFQTMAAQEGVFVGVSGAIDNLANGFVNLKNRTSEAISNFVNSGNAYIALAMAILQVFQAIYQHSQNQENARKQAAEAARQAERDSVRTIGSMADTYAANAEKVSQYQQQLAELGQKLAEATVGTDEYMSVKRELNAVQRDIINTFGEESGAVKGVTESLDDYAKRLDVVASKSAYLGLTNAENLSGTNAALKLFGVDANGNSVVPDTQLSLNGVSLDYSALTNMLGLSNYTQAREARLQKILGDLYGALRMTYKEDARSIQSSGELRAIDGMTNHVEKVTEQFTDLQITGLTVADTIAEIDKQIQILKADGDMSGATFLSSLRSQIISATGYNDALPAYQQWLDGFLRYDSDMGEAYQKAMALFAGSEFDLSKGNVADAATKSAAAIELLRQAIEDTDDEIAKSELLKLLYGEGGKAVGSEMLSDIAAGQLKYRTGGAAYGFDLSNFQGEDANTIVETGEKYASNIDAANDGLGRQYYLYQQLSLIAQYYDTTVADIVNRLKELGYLTAGSSTGPTISAMRGKPASYESFTGQESTADALGQVGQLEKRFDEFNEAKKIYDTMFAEDGSIINLEVSEENLDELNEYMGTSFKEVTEENADAFKKAFEGASEETYAEAENMMADTLRVLQSGGVNVAEMVNADGTIAFDQVSAALANLEQSADTASAAAATVAADNLKTLAGMRFSMVVDPATGDIKTVVDGGGTTTDTPKPRGGGGGGGTSSQLSKAYQSDIDALDEIIDLWKKLLNYYDEGSDQWIKRQTDIIDKYKAGVEIAQTEYNRLIAKGLKQTDDDVKTLVDKILDYQDAIFQESENLWEAVRQNQIDAIQHTLDQNDAATQLEETHHELVLAIRDERRELEDELKAARNAYSEVMTPQELDALFSADDFAELMGKLADIEGDAMSMYRDYRSQIAAVSEDETYLIEHITDEFERQYELKMKEYEVAKQELAVARAQRELDNVREERNTAMLINGSWQWVADPAAVLEAENKLAEAQQELADAQDEYDFQTLIKRMEAQSSELQKQIDALEALRFSMDELANQIHLFSDKVYKDLLTYLSATAQASFSKFEGSTAVPQFHTGGVVGKGGLAQLHDDEIIFNSADAAKLWRLVHNSPGVQVDTGAVLQGIAKLAVGKPAQATGSQAGSVSNVVQIGDLVIEGEKARQFIEVLRDVVAPYQPNNN